MMSNLEYYKKQTRRAIAGVCLVFAAALALGIYAVGTLSNKISQGNGLVPGNQYCVGNVEVTVLGSRHALVDTTVMREDGSIFRANIHAIGECES